MKKWLSVLLAAVMLLAMAGIAGAETPKEATGKIMFQNVETGESVTAYKVAEYIYDTTKGQYTDAKWVDKIQDWIKDIYGVDNLAVNARPKDVTETAFYEAMRSFVEKNIEKIDTLSELKAGSYICLISGGSTVHQLHLVSLIPQQKEDGTWELTGGEKIDAKEKASRPVLDKTMKVEEKKTKQDQDTAAIGDTVTFDIYATVPEYPDKATNETYTITDTMAKGLINNKDVKVWLVKESANSTDITEFCKIEYHAVEADTDQGFTITFDYGKIKEVASGTVSEWMNNGENQGDYAGRVDTQKNMIPKGVHIQYTARVSENIVLGSDENKNEATLEYSNNPYGNTTGHIKDEVRVYTYGLKVEKKDGKTKAMLEGAEFEIYKINGEKKTQLSFKQVADGQYVVAKAGEKGTVTTVAVSKKNEGDADSKEVGKLEIRGLDVGSYELVETKAPQDYNKLTQPEPFTITQDGKTHKYIDKTTSAYKNEEILNYKGIKMPSTGGMGTTIFMVAGIGVMACAVAALMLVLKRQKKNEG